MKNKIFITLIILISLVPTALMPLSYGEGGANEKAKLFPSLWENGKPNVSYLSQLSDWFDKNFGGRDEMITLHNKAIATIFGESAEEKVIAGTDGWLFYNETIDDYCGLNTMTRDEIMAVKKSLELAEEYLRSRGIDFVFTVAPNKNSVYSEKMPARYIKSQKMSNADSLGQALEESNVDYANLFDPFRKENRVLYRKTDSHWTYEGAGLAADILLEHLNREFVPIYGGETYTYLQTGDLFKMLYPAGEDKDPEIKYTQKPGFAYSKPIRSTEDNFIMTNKSDADGNLYMFRDSFGNTLYEYMAEHFANCTFSRAMPYDLTAVVKAEADCAVIEIVERNIPRLLTDPPIFPSPEREPKSAMTDITGHANIQKESDSELSGYTKISVNDENAYDGLAPTYIETGDKFYEATPCPGGFCAYIPTDPGNGEIKVFRIND